MAKNIKNEGFHVLVVDDGSGEKYSEVFESIQPYATVVTHTKNKGKGAALKTGMNYLLYNGIDFENVITCDADGQHKVEDVVRVSESLHNGHKFVLTVRTPKKDVPFRSKFGNALSRVVYTLLTNRYLTDNQSGLRGFNKCHVEWLVDVEKDNYDYEMNVLYYAAKKNVNIHTLSIEALYIDNNSSSHFNPILDTVRIYRSLFGLAISSFIAFFVAEALIVGLSLTVGYRDIFLTVPGVGAVSYFVCIILNKYIVFRGTPCYDYWNMLVYTIISYFVYTPLCLLWMYAMDIPLWLSFNITYFACIPLKYYLHKFIYIALRTKE